MNTKYIKSKNVPSPTDDQNKASQLWNQSFEDGHLSEEGLHKIAQLLQVPVDGDVVDGILQALGELNFIQLCQEEQLAVAQLGMEIEGYYFEEDGVNKYLIGFKTDDEYYLFDSIEYQQLQEKIEEVGIS